MTKAKKICNLHAQLVTSTVFEKVVFRAWKNISGAGTFHKHVR